MLLILSTFSSLSANLPAFRMYSICLSAAADSSAESLRGVRELNRKRNDNRRFGNFVRKNRIVSSIPAPTRSTLLKPRKVLKFAIFASQINRQSSTLPCRANRYERGSCISHRYSSRIDPALIIRPATSRASHCFLLLNSHSVLSAESVILETHLLNNRRLSRRPY